VVETRTILLDVINSLDAIRNFLVKMDCEKAEIKNKIDYTVKVLKEKQKEGKL